VDNRLVAPALINIARDPAQRTVYAVFMPYALEGFKFNATNTLKSLALPRGLEPLFSP